MRGVRIFPANDDHKPLGFYVLASCHYHLHFFFFFSCFLCSFAAYHLVILPLRSLFFLFFSFFFFFFSFSQTSSSRPFLQGGLFPLREEKHKAKHFMAFVRRADGSNQRSSLGWLGFRRQAGKERRNLDAFSWEPWDHVHPRAISGSVMTSLGVCV